MQALLIEVLKVSLGLLGGLVGAFIGARWSLSRFKRERGYDRRIEWHLATLRLLDNIGIAYALGEATPGGSIPEAMAVRRRFARVATESEVFSRPDVSQRVRQAYDAYRGVDDALARGSVLDEVNRRKRAIYKAHAAISMDLKRLLPPEPSESSVGLTLFLRRLPGRRRHREVRGL